MAEKKTYEKSLARLEEIVAALDSGKLSLDESVALFEEGQKLVKYCSDCLDAAEKKLKIVVDEDE